MLSQYDVENRFLCYLIRLLTILYTSVLCIGQSHILLASSFSLIYIFQKFLPKGLYILPMFFFLYFCNFFNGRRFRPGNSESSGPIFTKISGLVDGWKGLFNSLSFFRFLKGRCHGNQLKSKNRRFSRTNLHCRAAVRKGIATSQFRFQKIK